jgi:hypothetical protein
LGVDGQFGGPGDPVAAARSRGAGVPGGLDALHGRVHRRLQKSIGDDIDNPRFVELVGEFALSSERFRTLWARHDVRSLEDGTTTVNHPVVGKLFLHRDKLPVDDLLLVLYYADQGSQSDEKLRLLASLAQTTPAPASAGSA